MKSTFSAAVVVALLAVSAVAAGADADRAKQIVAGKCFMCHGMDGESASRSYPRLAGQHSEYVAKQLADFKSGRRKGDTMNDMVTDLTPEDMKALAAYFEAKKIGPQKVDDPDLAAVGRYIFLKGNQYSQIPACASCHGEKGLGTPQLPRLAGQQASYTASQLKLFNNRDRNNDNAVMHSIASKLTELEMKAVAEYISGLD